jgi:uncharacterized protein YbjT (DUF2867 family)
MEKTIAVFGANGKVGGKISEILLNSGHKLKVITRSADKLKKFADMGAEVIVADIMDIHALTDAFKDAESIYVMTPPNFTATSYRVFQRKVGDAIIDAIKNSGIKHVVNLSSCGGHIHEGNGIIAGLAEQEVKLNQIENVNVLHLRPAYFLDNTLLNITLIKEMGINGSTADADCAIPMVATKDIAAIAADRLSRHDFTNKSVLPILGYKDYSFKELTDIISRAIGKPGLQYVQFTNEQARQSMISQGISTDVANDIIAMENSLKNGIMNYEQRTTKNSSPTSAETFVNEVFVPLYNSL